MTEETKYFRSGRARRALVLGGARSGKSALAERLARSACAARVYIATAEPRDAEMRARIEKHRADRGAGWETVESPLDLTGALRAADGPERVVLVDCLTLWLSNVMLAGDRDADGEGAALAALLPTLAARIVLVSNEVGLGLVPDTPLGRAFRDAQGRLNQTVASACDLVLFTAAGLPLVLKAPS
jgi:adenosylcobinamide kinase/adenosylcobinamide-phosphate guanylyltransferase